jgi:hypothetical protein
VTAAASLRWRERGMWPAWNVASVECGQRCGSVARAATVPKDHCKLFAPASESTGTKEAHGHTDTDRQTRETDTRVRHEDSNTDTRDRHAQRHTAESRRSLLKRPFSCTAAARSVGRQRDRRRQRPTREASS